MSEAAVTRTDAANSVFKVRLREDADRREVRMLDHIERVPIGLSEQTEKIETTLLKEFRKWAISL